MDNVQTCRLMKQLSQDMLDTAMRCNGQLQYTRCDSSDCLVCQGQRTFCSEAVTSHVCSWLERRFSATNSHMEDPKSGPVPSDDCCSMLEQRQNKRLRLECSRDAADCPAGARLHQQAASKQHDALSCNLIREHGAQPWAWRPEWADRQHPAPCRMVELAQLQSPSELRGTGQGVRRGDMICGLEFSVDGQMIATAGISKQVALYALATLSEQQQQQQHTEAMQQAEREQRQHTQQHSQQQLPSLPPVALVRLPGKVSSIAWSPDMEGVMTIGDYDGTLTQVHVASGHYLNEVDAHSGRRIWSVAHSSLHPHLAATASDDCTAKLWAGRAFSEPVATITLPGKPAVCGVDFSQSQGSILSLAAADARVYLYDLRQLTQPLAVLHGHKRPVSYAKFFGSRQLVSASTDGTLAAWDLNSVLGLQASSVQGAGGGVSGHSSSSSSSATTWPGSSGICEQQQQHHSAAQQQQQDAAAGPSSSSKPAAPLFTKPWKVFRGHLNEKNFVGLSVQPAAGLMAVGSESGEVFAYHTSWSDPLARLPLAQQQLRVQMQQPAAVAWSKQRQQQRQQQTSACAVAWRPANASYSSAAGSGPTMLAAATSLGECKLLTLVEPAMC